MAHILYYRGKGHGFMSGVTEYLILVDADKVKQEEIAGHTAPGFQLHSDIDLEIDTDIHCLPCERPLVAHQISPEIFEDTLPPVLQQHEHEIRLFQELFGVVNGSLIFAVSILSDVQHMQANDPHIVQELNEAKALMVMAVNFMLKS